MRHNGVMGARVASIGECMIELRERPDGLMERAHGGDTLNTAIYLARLGVAVDYATALGDDAWSNEMALAWADEGIGLDLVRRIPGLLPGLYIIHTDHAGERSFLYWRESAAARRLFDPPHGARLGKRLAQYDVVYFSGITLSIYDAAAREALFTALATARGRGCRVAFDTNFRPRGWPDRDLARTLFRRAFAHSDIVLASVDDLWPLFGDDGEAELAAHAPLAERVLKLASPRVRIDGRLTVEAPPVARVVDTTAAGDSFAAAYLAARLDGHGPEAAARAGHRLAGIVVGYPGAIIPREAMEVP